MDKEKTNKRSSFKIFEYAYYAFLDAGGLGMTLRFDLPVLYALEPVMDICQDAANMLKKFAYEGGNADDIDEARALVDKLYHVMFAHRKRADGVREKLEEQKAYWAEYGREISDGRPGDRPGDLITPHRAWWEKGLFG